MTPNFTSHDNRVQLFLGDCLDILKQMPENHVDSIVTDPPYGLSFMGKKWDYDVPSAEIWRECLRVLKPGGHLLAFAGTRTQHRMAVKIEDAGFEIRDMIAWVYGSGFPKSLDVSKAIDKAAGAEREVVGEWKPTGTARPAKNGSHSCAKTTADCGYEPDTDAKVVITAPATEPAKQWQGWGTALKPALEPITVARKPLRGTVAENVLKHGTGALNVDGCRVAAVNGDYSFGGKNEGIGFHTTPGMKQERSEQHPAGRWPANLVHDGSEEVVGLFPETGPAKAAPRGALGNSPFSGINGSGRNNTNGIRGHEDNGGSAARFFYCAKASKKDRDEGCEGLEERPSYMVENGSKTAAAANGVRYERHTVNRNNHPTVKPTALMRYLCRLVTPPGGIVLDPFMGSGSTGKAAVLEGFHFIGIEREPEYLEIAKLRINAIQPCLPL